MTTFDFKRRFVLKGMGALGASGILVACGGGSSSSGSSSNNSSHNGSGPIDPTNASKGTSNTVSCANTARIPLTIDASFAATGLPTTVPVYAYIVGLVPVPGTGSPAGQNNYYYYSASQSKPVVMVGTSDNTNPQGTGPGMTSGSQSAMTNYANAWADFSIPLDRTCATTIDLATFNATNLQNFGTGGQAFSGRIYFSVGKPKIPFTVQANPTVNGYTAPVFGSTTGAPGSLCLYDWLEFSFDSTNALNINTTQVDQFGFQISMQATGATVQGGEQGVYNHTRSSILSTINALPSPYSTIINVPTTATGVDADAYPPQANTSNILRAISPKQMATSSDTYFSNVINTWYSNWANTPLTVTDPATGTYVGKVVGGVLTFQQGSTWSASGATAFTNTTITSYDVWQCANSLASGSAAQKNVQKQIAAAFNRGTMAYILNDTSGSFTPTLSSNYTTTPYNQWAQQFHLFSSNGLAYGFPYDDVGSEQPTIATTGTTSLRIQLGIFS